MYSAKMNVTEEQLARKHRSEAILRAEGIPFIAHLPAIESAREVTRRSAGEVAERLQALEIVAVKAEGLEQEIVADIVSERGLSSLFSPRERAFIDDPQPNKQDCIQFVWRYEAAWVLLWALNMSDAPLGLPREICNVPFLVKTVTDRPNLAARGLRPVAELLDEADLIYRCHWATRQARLKQRDVPAGLDPGVTTERHYALNWLIGDGDEAWDDVNTNT